MAEGSGRLAGRLLRQADEISQLRAQLADRDRLLALIVEDWCRDEHHDIPLVLIEQARALLRPPATPEGGGA
jgi:hypothetical protein